MAELTDDPRDRPRALRRRGHAPRPSQGGCGCSGAESARLLRHEPTSGEQVFGGALYDEARPRGRCPTRAVEASLGCGVPTAVADLHEGETVLDLGSGAGADVLISARRVGPDAARPSGST